MTYHHSILSQPPTHMPNLKSIRFVDYMRITLLLLFINFACIEAKQTVIAESLASKDDKILIKMLEETHNYIEYQRIISSIPFQCKAILKNQLTKNTPQKITKIDLHLDYRQVVSLQRGEILLNFLQSQMIEIKRIDKILDILNGRCLYYSTSTFVYEYCHKQHVRQFDTAFTKANNAKPEFEDISMGVYNPQVYKNRRIKRGIVDPTPEERKVKLPELSDFEIEYNFLYIEDIDSKHGHLEFEESDDGNLLFSSTHLVLNDKYFVEYPLFLKITCQQRQENNLMKEIINYGLIVDSYTLIYTSKQGRCDKFTSHHLMPRQITYFHDSSPQPLRAYGRYLFGNVEEICTQKWNWQRGTNNQQFNSNLQEGSLLFLQIFNEKEKQTQYHYATIKKIINSQLIELDTALGKSFKIVPTFNLYIDRSTIKSQRLIGNITKCQLMFNKNLNLKESIILKYIGNGIMKISQQTPISKGDNLGCICKSIVQNNFKIIDLDITITKHLWHYYFQGLVSSNTNIYSSHLYRGKQFLLRQCHDYTCFPFTPKQKNSTSSSHHSSKFTQIVKICTNNPAYIFNSSNVEYLYILTIKNSGIIKLTTRSKSGLIYTYLISQGQIIKIIEFANGTKQIIKENKFYQNITISSSHLHANYIYIKISLLPNGSYYGGIWKAKDYAYFPRFQLFDEELLSLKRHSGYAYLRILNLDNVKNKQDMGVVKYMNKLKTHYSMKEKLAEDPSATLFLNKSYSINYYYVSGKYCEPPVNKFRRTTVNLKCGAPWFSISKLLETSPCQYWIEIETTLLCKEGYKQVLENDESLFNRKGNDVVINNGVFCHPLQGLLDQATPYLYLQQSVQ